MFTTMLKLVLATCVLAVAMGEKTPQEIALETGGRLLYGSRISRADTGTSSDDDVCKTNTPKCNDNVLTICHQGSSVSMSCSDASQNRQKYCNCAGTECQEIKPACPTPTPTPGAVVKCSNLDTKLPDTDCTKFSYCNSKGELTRYECASGLVYNFNTGKCGVRTVELCRNMRCPATGIAWIPFANPIFYVTCLQGKGEVSKCPGDYVFQRPSCQYACTKPGYFGDYKDNTVYYICTRTGATYKTVKVTCKQGEVYNSYIEACTKDDTTTTAPGQTTTTAPGQTTTTAPGQTTTTAPGQTTITAPGQTTTIAPGQTPTTALEQTTTTTEKQGDNS